MLGFLLFGVCCVVSCCCCGGGGVRSALVLGLVRRSLVLVCVLRRVGVVARSGSACRV